MTFRMTTQCKTDLSHQGNLKVYLPVSLFVRSISSLFAGEIIVKPPLNRHHCRCLIWLNMTIFDAYPLLN